MDVYVDKKQKVWVVNINALGDEMNPGLFTSDEISTLMMDDSIPFRIVEEEGNTLPSEQVFYQLPVDMHQFTSETSIQEYINQLSIE